MSEQEPYFPNYDEKDSWAKCLVLTVLIGFPVIIILCIAGYKI